MISDNKNKEYKIILNQKMLSVQNIKKPIQVVHFFDATKRSSKAQIRTFNKIEKRLKTKVSMLHTPVDNASNPENRQLLEDLQDNIHTEDKKRLPLVVIFRNNHYYSHFEGTTPVEMIRYDIQQALKK